MEARYDRENPIFSTFDLKNMSKITWIYFRVLAAEDAAVICGIERHI